MSRLVKFALGLACAIAFAQPAAADISRNLNTQSATSTTHTGNFGTVTLTQSGTNVVLVTVTPANGSGNFSGSVVFGFNEPGVSLTPTNFSNFSNAAFSVGSTNVTEAPFGTFGYTINCSACSNGNSGPGTLSFDVTATGLTVSQFKANGSGTHDYYDFAEFHGAGLVAAFPEPPTYALFASALLAFYLLRRRNLRPVNALRVR